MMLPRQVRIGGVQIGGNMALWHNICKNHIENCQNSGILCFKSNEIGHYARECTMAMPMERSMQGSSNPYNVRGGRPPNPGRAVTIQNEMSKIAEPSQNRNIGLLAICSKQEYMLSLIMKLRTRLM